MTNNALYLAVTYGGDPIQIATVCWLDLFNGEDILCAKVCNPISPVF